MAGVKNIRTEKKLAGRWSVVVMAMMMALGGCAQRESASDYVRRTSYAVAPTLPGPLKEEFARDSKAHAGTSGFRLIASGTDAFLSRLAMVRMAEHSVDLQYYSVHDDSMSQLLLEEMLRAADRGVRVRVLIDDLNIGKIDEMASVLDTHPLIEIRTFNPLTTTGHNPLVQMMHHVTELGRYSRRMHNKVLIVDNQLALLGGRNIGDSYFDASDDFNFSDLDVLSVGPIVPPISRSFDLYWNSEDAFPLEAIKENHASETLQRTIRVALAENWEAVAQRYPQLPIRELDARGQLRGKDGAMVWAKSELSVDLPEKVQPTEEETKSPPMQKLAALLKGAQKEFIGVAPYLVPQEEGVAVLKELTDRGVSVRLITNSLASTDVVPVHTAYDRYRQAMVENGVELYELKPMPGKRSRQTLFGSSSRSSLHAKTYVVDKREVVIGSFNLDPRSWQLNTEMAVIIHSPEIAARIYKMFEETVSPAMSYKVTIPEESRSLQWVTRDKEGREQVYDTDPEPGFWRSMMYGFFSLLPLEDQM